MVAGVEDTALSNGNGPIAVVFAAPDHVLCVGAVVSREVDGVICGVVVADPDDYQLINNGETITVEATEDGATLNHRLMP